MRPRQAAFSAILLGAASAAVSHVYVRTPGASPGLDVVPVFASALAFAAVWFLLYAALLKWDKKRARPKASWLAVQLHVLAGIAYLASLILVSPEGAGAGFRMYGISLGGWVAAVLLWPFAAPWTVACLAGIAPCP